MSQTQQTAQSVLDPTVARCACLDDVRELGATHFIGIGGAGMSVLAEMLHERGVAVSGSDREENAKTQRLRELGVRVCIGQRADNVHHADTVVYSSAIKADNPELAYALAHDIRVIHRSDVLALLMVGKQGVTVAGAHGKTTTSSLLAHLFERGGEGELADPSYAIGGMLQSADGVARDGGHAGSGVVMVAEADESDGSFAKYHPSIAIITNVEADHLDHYGTVERYRQAFVEHAGHATRWVVLCVDDEGSLAVLRALPQDVASRVVAVTTNADTQWRAGVVDGVRVAACVGIDEASEQAGSGNEHAVLSVPAAVTGQDACRVPMVLSIPGVHNARNAAAAITAACLLGMPVRRAVDSVADFLGASRRFEVRGVADGVTVVDDYAHHPTEIEALLKAARGRYPQAVLRVVFQPHLFSRTRDFAPQFAQALALADDVTVTDIYPARERQEDFPEVSAASIVREYDSAESCAMRVIPDAREAALAVAHEAGEGDVIITVGAGDIVRQCEVLLTALREREGKVA